jgi:hypothetical protein
MTIKELVTTLPGSLGVNVPEWTTAHRDVPPEWLHQEGHPCSTSGFPGVMQIVNGKLVCVRNSPQESEERIMARIAVRELVKAKLSASC